MEFRRPSRGRSAACNPVFGSSDGPVRRATLYSDSGRTNTYTGDDTAVVAIGPAPEDSSVREVFWRTDTPYYDDQQSCITWNATAASELDPELNVLMQPGLAMRIAPTGAEGDEFKAVTVTENVWMYGVWLFNVHVWDTTASGSPFSVVETFDLSSIVGVWGNVDGEFVSLMVPPPWHVCGRTLGDQFQFKVWTGTDPEPAWNDPTHVFTTTLPAGWDHPGYSGGYIGHLHDGQTGQFSGFTSGPLCLAPDMIDTTHCQQVAG